jgi:hypothetical protein
MSIMTNRKLTSMFFGVFSLVFTATVVPAAAQVPASIGEWEALWTTVLSHSVDEAGRIDFASLSRSHGDLDRIVAFISAIDPISQPSNFPDRKSRLAYYINAYNALAMYGVVDAGVPESLGGFRKFSFFSLRTFNIGGRSISLYNFENDVIRPLGEERIHFALNCMVVSCPRLPRVAFTPDRLDKQLDEAARTFVREGRNLRIDVTKRELWLSSIFKFYTEDFLAHASSLLTYVSKIRANEIPADFKVRFLDYDWTVNMQSRAGRE